MRSLILKVFDGMDIDADENDTQKIFERLEAGKSISSVLSSIEGPYTFVYLNVSEVQLRCLDVANAETEMIPLARDKYGSLSDRSIISSIFTHIPCCSNCYGGNGEYGSIRSVIYEECAGERKRNEDARDVGWGRWGYKAG